MLQAKQLLEGTNPQASARAEQILERFCSSLPDTDPEKLVQIFYGVIAQNVTYTRSWETTADETVFTWYRPLLAGSGVCEGIAQLLLKLCMEKHIPCVIVHGEADGGNGAPGLHAWNQIMLDLPGVGPAWYHADCTWDLGMEPQLYSFFLKGDVYMRIYRHDWLPQNFMAAARNAPPLKPLPPGVLDMAGRLLHKCVEEG